MGDKRKGDGALFMSVNEFADMIGISYDAALAVCKSEAGPPLIKSGRNHLVYRPTAGKWAEDAAMARMQI